VAVDGYCWLHQGAYSCAQELVYNKGIDKLISYCKIKLDQITGSGVRAIVVFDGNKLNMKGEVENERHRKRVEARKEAEEL
jgi:exonuclease-1